MRANLRATKRPSMDVIEERPLKKQKLEDSIRCASGLAERIKILSKAPSVENCNQPELVRGFIKGSVHNLNI